jgi:hypothetical protein
MSLLEGALAVALRYQLLTMSHPLTRHPIPGLPEGQGERLLDVLAADLNEDLRDLLRRVAMVVLECGQKVLVTSATIGRFYQIVAMVGAVN